MRFLASQARLAAATKATAIAVNLRPNMPILSGVLIEAGDEVKLSTFDYAALATATLESVITEPGRIVVPHRMLAQVMAVCPAGDVLLDADTWLTITQGKSRWQLPLMLVEDYPTLPAIGDRIASTDGAELMQALTAVAAAAKDDDTGGQPLNVVRLGWADDYLTLCASDGHRIHTATVPAETTGDDWVLIPAERVRAMAKLLQPGPVELVNDGNLFGFRTGTTAMATRLADSSKGWLKFESYLASTTDAQLASCVIDRQALTQALKQVGGFATQAAQGHRHLTLTFEHDELTLQAGTSTDGAGSTAIPVEHDGRGLRVVFNVAFLLDALATSDARSVSLSFSAPTKPVGIANGDGPVTQVLMPVRQPESAWLDELVNA